MTQSREKKTQLVKKPWFKYKPDEVATIIIIGEEFKLDYKSSNLEDKIKDKIQRLISIRGEEEKEEFCFAKYTAHDGDAALSGYYLAKKIKRKETESKYCFHDRVEEEKKIWDNLQIETVVKLRYPFHFHKEPANYRDASYYLGRIVGSALSAAGTGAGCVAVIGVPFGPLGILGGIIAGAIIGFFIGIFIGFCVASGDVPAQYHIDREKALDKHNNNIDTLTKKLNKKPQRKVFRTDRALQPFLGDGLNDGYIVEEENEQRFSEEEKRDQRIAQILIPNPSPLVKNNSGRGPF